MVDVVSPAVRSRMMAGIKGRDTKPELVLRRGLHARGFRFRLHDRTLPGRPDLVFPKYRAVIFAHGCFWHGHNCHLFKWPQTRKKFWFKKIHRNKANDERTLDALSKGGWRVAIIWECALKGRQRLDEKDIFDRCARWLNSNRRQMMLPPRLANS